MSVDRLIPRHPNVFSQKGLKLHEKIGMESIFNSLFLQLRVVKIYKTNKKVNFR